MKTAKGLLTVPVLCVVVCALAACRSAPAPTPSPEEKEAYPPPPRRHVFFHRPHSSAPTWFPPDGLTWIQRLYYTLNSHVGSVAAAGFGTFFGPLGPFVSSFSQPYLSAYVSRLTGDVVARSISNGVQNTYQDDNDLPSQQDTVPGPYDQYNSMKTASTPSVEDTAKNVLSHAEDTRHNDNPYNSSPNPSTWKNGYFLNKIVKDLYLLKDKSYDDLDSVDKSNVRDEIEPRIDSSKNTDVNKNIFDSVNGVTNKH